MDRNFCPFGGTNYDVRSLSARRAWIEMVRLSYKTSVGAASLSARRAWIEISPAGCWRDARRVALRKESVDRNNPGRAKRPRPVTSLSARRAWIEMVAAQ